MFRKHISTPILAFALLFLALGCQDTADPVLPVEPQMAKPVKPPPEPDPAEPELQEFWVYAEPTDENPHQQCIHFVASGSFTGMGVNVSPDYFFNGFQDLHDHYEWYFVGGPPGVSTEFSDDPDLGVIGHEDVCFNGEYDSSDEPFNYLPDYLTTSIGNTGYDPIALVPAVITEVTKRTTGFRFFRPEGVVVGGETYAPGELTQATSIWDHDGDGHGDTYSNPDFTFYTRWKGEEASGNFFLNDLSISDVTCTLERGKGRNKNQILGTTISLTASFAYGVTDPAPSKLDYWGQGHILARPAESPAGTVSQVGERMSTPSQDGSRTFSWTFDGNLGTELEAEFALDYLFGSGSEEAYSFVYNPGLNGVFTTAGFDDALANAWDIEDNLSTEIYDEKFPVAHSGFVPVTCH